MDYVDRFLYNKPSMHPWDEVYLIMMYDHFDVFLESAARILLSIFTSIFIREIDLKFSFFVGSLCGLGISITVAPQNEGSVLSLWILWNSLKSVGIRSSLNV